VIQQVWKPALRSPAILALVAAPPRCVRGPSALKAAFRFVAGSPGIAGLLALWVAAAVVPPSSARAAGTNTFSTANAKARAQVVIVRDRQAMRTFQASADRVRFMVNRALTDLTAKASVAAAWRSLVSTQDVVGLKVLTTPGPTSGTRPAVVAAVIEGLRSAGLPATNIVVWDKHYDDLREAGFLELTQRYGVRVAGGAEAGYDPTNFYQPDTPILGNLVWGDFEFGKPGEGVGRKSFVSKLVSRELTKIINITPLLNHNVAGVSGNLYGLAMGSVDNTWRFETQPERLAQAVPEIYALPVLSDHVVLNIVDALLCQYQGNQRGLLHYSTVLNEIRMSRDPVALDVLSLKELDRQRGGEESPPGTVNAELYQNAALLELGVADLKRIETRTFK
jgi:hypothetical protein